MPYKRFASPWLFSLAKQYLNVPEGPQPKASKRNATRTTYRSVLRHDRQKIGYPVQPIDEHENEGPEGPRYRHQPVVPPSLLCRFIGWLGSLSLTLDKAREMILQHDPNSTCHRVGGRVDPFRTRSDERVETLETARQLLLIMPEWERCFGRPLFPQFATRSGFS